jgi:hypothetical protein
MELTARAPNTSHARGSWTVVAVRTDQLVRLESLAAKLNYSKTELVRLALQQFIETVKIRPNGATKRRTPVT